MEFDEAEKLCAVCGSSGKFTCGGCKLINYCSQAHQKQNWTIHKETCTPFKTTIDLESGKEHLIATRDLKPGMIVLEEPVAFYSPIWYLLLEFNGKLLGPEDPDLSRICVTCGKLLQRLEIEVIPAELRSYNNSCTKCTWPVCSVVCQNNPMHAENECKLFAEYKVPFPPLNLLESCQVPLPPIMLTFTCLVGMIRGMYLKRKDPKLFSNFESLLHDRTVADPINVVMDTSRILVLVLKLIINKECRSLPITELSKLPLLKDEEDYLKIFPIIYLGQFIVSKMHHMWGDPCPKSASYMYLKASSLSHSCVPNCYWAIGPPPDYKIRIRTTSAVKKGDLLTITVSGSTLQDAATGSRQKSLKEKGIMCKCDRCVDPSEVGLFYSAIACRLCKKRNKVSNTNNLGYLLPVSPLLGYETLWKCNTEGCGYTMEGAEYQKTIEIISDELKESHKRCQEKHSVTQSNKTEAGNLYWDEVGTEAIKIGEKHGLHPNNSIIHSTIKTSVLLSFNGEEINEQFPEVVQRRLQRLLYCLAIEDKINPGLSVERAGLHALVVKLLSWVLFSPKWIQSMSLEKVRSYHKVFKKSAAEAFKFYRGEFCEPCETMNMMAEMVSKLAAEIEKLPWLK